MKYKWLKTFWSCVNYVGCDKIYTYERCGLKHLVTVHDGCAHLKECSVADQQQLLDEIEAGTDVFTKIRAMLAQQEV
jgi:hypothetical protein